MKGLKDERKNERKDERMKGWKDERMNERMKEWMLLMLPGVRLIEKCKSWETVK